LTAPADALLVSALKRDRLIVGAALAFITIAAWSCMLPIARTMSGSAPATTAMPGMNMAPEFTSWTIAHPFWAFAMWSTMMIGMMTPSAAPMVLLYAQVARQAGTLGRVFAPPGWFAGGYLLAWTSFAALATLAQAGLERAALLSPMLVSASHRFGGVVLVGVGLYQLMPLKQACLAQCRSPLAFVQRHGGFRADAAGSLRLGRLHGYYCIGCCWALMALLFVGGVMNVLWIGGIAILVLGEKVLPHGAFLARVAGFAALAGGVWMTLG